MNDTNWQTGGPMIEGGPAWLTLSFALIGLGVLFALLVLWWGTRLASRRKHTREELEARGEAHVPGERELRTGVPPAVTPAPPPIADAPLPATPVAAAAVAEPAPEPSPSPSEPAPLADTPIAAAAPMDATPASLAASEPEAAPATRDDLTRMKGVGPRLAERLNAVGITRFDQLAALSPEEADALDAKLGDFRGRLQRDRWIEQAGFLARGDTAGYEAVFGKL